jgi:very-short-patch-repair endonuclease
MKNPIAAAVRGWLRTHDHVITLDEARRLGLTDLQVRHLLRTGAWQRVHRGVYRDGAVARTSRIGAVAAVAACGGAAVVSHGTAAWLWGLLDQPPDRVHLAVGPTFDHRLRGVVVHRSNDLDPARTVWHRGVACTDPLRTLADLGSCTDTPAVEGAVDRALAKRLVTVRALEAELARMGRRGRRGPAVLRNVLTERGFIGGPSPSVLESRAMRAFRRARVPIGSCEQRAGPEGEYWIDFTVEPWPGGAMLAVETHGYVWHFSPEHLGRDLARQRRLTLAGWTYLPFTWRDITDEPDRVADDIWTALAQRHASRPRLRQRI